MNNKAIKIMIALALVTLMSLALSGCSTILYYMLVGDRLTAHSEYHTAEEVEKMFYENQEEFQYVADMILSKDGLKGRDPSDTMIHDDDKHLFTNKEWKRVVNLCDLVGACELSRYGDTLAWHTPLKIDEKTGTEDHTSLWYYQNDKLPEEGYEGNDGGSYEIITHLTSQWWIKTRHRE